VAVLILAGALSLGASEYNARSPLGINFWNLSFDAQFQPFLDYFKTSRPLWSRSKDVWDDGRKLNLRPDGYPASLLAGQWAGTLVCAQDNHPVGRMVLLYDGEGTIEVSMRTVTVASREAGKLILNVPAGWFNSGFVIEIRTTNVANPIRNIRLYDEKQLDLVAQGKLFQPEFLERVRPFTLLRFMDWMKINNSRMADWSQRTTPQSQTQSGPNGVCLEHLIELAHLMDADPWFCIPFAATDDCVRQIATFIRDHLRGDLRAHYEYCNEIWNGQVSDGAGYCDSMGTLLGLGSGWTAQHKYWAKRLGETMGIVYDVYKDYPKRRVIVAATQRSNMGVTTGLFSYGDIGKYADALAIAPYLRSENTNNLDKILAELEAGAAAIKTELKTVSDYAKSKNLRFICYEAGQELYNISKVNEELAVQVRFHPRQAAILKTYYDSWKAVGGEMMAYYTLDSKSWGLIEGWHVDETQSVPYQTTLKWMQDNPAWWTVQRDTPTVLPVQGATVVRGGQGSAQPASFITMGSRGPEALGAVFDLRGRALRQGLNAAWVMAPGVRIARPPHNRAVR
jgi:hypothetical protein